MTKRKCAGSCGSRRQALQSGGRFTVAAFLTAVGVNLVWSCGTKEKDSANGDAGSTAVTPDSSGTASLSFTTYPNLQNVGGVYRVSVGGKPVAVSRTSATEVIALVAICTHEGAVLDGDSVSGFTCPRHGATYSIKGVATGGPASGSLTRYTATIDTAEVKLKTS